MKTSENPQPSTLNSQLSTFNSPLVPPGYKQTEVGVIPEDWEISSLFSICKEPMQNGVFYKPSLKGFGVKLINVGDLYTCAPIDSDALQLFGATDKERKIFKVEDGDLFFTRSSVVPSGIAHCNIYCSPKPDSVVFDSHVIRLRPDTNKVVPLYLFRFCVAAIARRYLVSHAKTGTMTTIDQGVLGKCPVLLPSSTEQEAIAEALSDADALLESLEQLLTKKRHLKQGAMQELLTGKNRLPGFEIKPGNKQTEVGVVPEDWQLVPLGNVITEFRGGASLKPSDFTSTGVQVLPKGGVGRTGWLHVEEGDFQYCAFEYVTAHPRNQVDETFTIVVLRDLVPSGPSIGQMVRIRNRGTLVLAQGVYGFKVNSYAVSGYLVQLSNTQWYRKLANSIMVGSTQVHITNKEFKRAKVPLPPPPEQKAIAAILSDIDTEIAALETKLTKTRQLKQGMMQELLTGRIRLI